MAAMTEKARREHIEAQVRAVEDDPQHERIRIPWKSNYTVCPVIEIPLDAVALNPGSHRIRAQLLYQSKMISMH